MLKHNNNGTKLPVFCIFDVDECVQCERRSANGGGAIAAKKIRCKCISFKCEGTTKKKTNFRNM